MGSFAARRVSKILASVAAGLLKIIAEPSQSTRLTLFTMRAERMRRRPSAAPAALNAEEGQDGEEPRYRSRPQRSRRPAQEGEDSDDPSADLQVPSLPTSWHWRSILETSSDVNAEVHPCEAREVLQRLECGVPVNSAAGGNSWSLLQAASALQV